jgi:hypothetical protein
MSQQLRSEENKKSRFQWTQYEQILKDLVVKNELHYDKMKEENFAELAKEMRESYKIAEITAENVRWKVRTPQFKKWLKNQKNGKKSSKKTSKKRKRESSSESSDDSSYGSEDGSGETDGSDDSMEDVKVDKYSNFSAARGFASQPVFWIVTDSDYWWYFMLRKWKIEAQHFAGKQFIEIQYKIVPPSVFDIQSLVQNSKQDSLKGLDINKPNIQNQIKEWKPITWKVALSTPLPLVPSLYKAARDGDYSWIQVPKNNSRRSTAFGDEEEDIDYVINQT